MATHIEAASWIGVSGPDGGDGEQAGSGRLADSQRLVAGVGPAQHQAADQPAEVVAVLDRVAGQPGEQLGVARRVLRVHLVERHHQAQAEEAVPDAVDDRPGEEVALARLQGDLHQLRPGAERAGGRRGPSSSWPRRAAPSRPSARLVGGSSAPGDLDPRPVRNMNSACFSALRSS